MAVRYARPDLYLRCQEMWRLSTLQLDSELRDEMCLAGIIPRIQDDDEGLVEIVLRALLKLWKSRFELPSGDLKKGDVREKFTSHDGKIIRKIGPNVTGGGISPPVELHEVSAAFLRIEN